MTDKTPVSDTAAKENLALRYSYEQLDAPHKVIADQVAALIVAYPDIVKLNDPAAQKKFLEDVSKSGVGEALKGLGEKGKDAAEAVRKSGIPLVSNLMDVAHGANELREGGQGVTNAATKGMDIALSPVTVPLAGLSEFTNEAKVIFNDMTPEKAKILGAEYASTLQARAVDRAGIEWWKAPFTQGFDGFFAYVGAGIAAVVDMVRKWTGATDTHSFSEHLTRAFNGADIKAVRTNMAETGTPGAEAWAHALTEGAEVQNRAGQNLDVKAPTKTDPVPTASDAPKDAAGKPVVAPANAGAVISDANRHAGVVMQDKANKISRGINTPVDVAVATAATATAIGTIRGGVEGLARGAVEAKQARADKLQAQADGFGKKAALEAKKLEADSLARKVAKVTPGQVFDEAKITAKMNEYTIQQGKFQQLADAEKEIADAARGKLKGRATEVLTGKWHWGSNLGRGPGKMVGGFLEERLHGGQKWLENAAQQFENMPEQFNAGMANAQAKSAADRVAQLKVSTEKAAKDAENAAARAEGKGAWKLAPVNREVAAKKAADHLQKAQELAAELKEARTLAASRKAAAEAVSVGGKSTVVAQMGANIGKIGDVVGHKVAAIGERFAAAGEAVNATRTAQIEKLAASARKAQPAVQVAEEATVTISKAAKAAAPLRGAVGSVGGMVAKGPGWMKPIGLGLAAIGIGSAVSSAAEAKAKYGEGEKSDAAAAGIDTVATVGGLISSSFAFVAAAPAAYLSQGAKLNGEANRSHRVPDDQALALVALVKPGANVHGDEGLRKIQALKAERDARLAAGKSLDVTLMLSTNGKTIIDIMDKQTAGGFGGEGMPTLSNVNLNSKLLEEAKLYLGSFGTLQSVAQLMGVSPKEVQQAVTNAQHPKPDAGLQLAAVEASKRAHDAEVKAHAAAKPVALAMKGKASVALGATHEAHANGKPLFDLPKIDLHLPKMPDMSQLFKA